MCENRERGIINILAGVTRRQHGKESPDTGKGMSFKEVYKAIKNSAEWQRAGAQMGSRMKVQLATSRHISRR